MAEFWADGPKSETPPGHWNVLANLVSDEMAPNLRIGGTGQPVDRLQWDVKLYLALNGAVHDAAIAAWGLKGDYDSVRPISMIRYMAGTGQSSDPPAVLRQGWPAARARAWSSSSPRTRPRPGGDACRLAGHEGEIAIKAWAGNPADPKTEIGGVSWILAANWVPYQLPTFVTPAFQGYISGHSSFSRAAAEVMTAFTGSEYFPGGVSGYTIKAGSLKFEKGPSDRHPPRVGDVLRRVGPGRPVAAVRRHPHPGRRLQRPHHRLAVRQGCVRRGRTPVRGSRRVTDAGRRAGRRPVRALIA